ncbi:hypothetical protein MVES1_002592 [Malassezia vespertilionis]|uniref:DUF7729 domain-containing protein n=1 Tax=Malassezia vespertilionis TaxID=2020962 RepID=A0A2N1JAM5_9BASI|nr:uncharacterized protein MVES1_002592 [Malassezia vespertilionis]PKI83583.1 hypothetical protein MVES_002447 [Malassezia vespertilionis]WFD07233.1 hypothetical protein MVES1_002592 [Malassezia vespertilionis]
MPVIDLIPTNISSTCGTFLTQLDQDNFFQQCTEPLIQATDIYTNATEGNTDAASLSESLDSLCRHSEGCEKSLVRQYISQFWDNCEAELEENDPSVMDLYNYIYIFNPFRDAICSRDKKNTYCLQSLSPFMASSPQPARRSVAADVVSDDEFWSQIMASIPTSNGTQDAAESLDPLQVFMFLSPSSSKDMLCSECAQHVLASYIAFEMGSPYALGLDRSDVLQSQQGIYEKARKECGQAFVDAVNQQANVQLFAESGGERTLPFSRISVLFVSLVALVSIL